jgi:predicted RNA-binding Zn ribbon-like protein
MWLTAATGETYRFDPGVACLELAHTGGPGYRAAFESLHTPEHLVAWLDGYLHGEPHAGPGLHPIGDVAPAGADADAAAPRDMAGPVTATDLAAAVALRNAVWAAVDATMAGAPLPGPAVAEINAWARRPPVTWHVTADGRRTRVAPVTVSQILATCASDAIDLVTGPAAGRLRQCGADDCFLVFVDTSRSGRRRWCSMARCGNRAKVASFRTRHRQEKA